jgi:hypothetical protein
MRFWWKLKPQFSIRKKLSPVERRLIARFRRICGGKHLPDREILLYFIQEREPLRERWPVLKEIDAYYENGSETFKKFVDRRKEKLRFYLLSTMQPDKRFISGRAAK